MVSNTPRPYFTPGNDLVPIVQESQGRAGRAENLAPPPLGFDHRTVQPVEAIPTELPGPQV